MRLQVVMSDLTLKISEFDFMMLITMSELTTWINTEVEKHGWSYNELARRAGLSSSGVSTVMTEKQGPGLEFCVGIARAFGEPPEKVLRIARLLPPLPEAVADEVDLLHVWRQLDPDIRKALLTMIRALPQSKKR